MPYPLPAELGEIIGSFRLDAVISQGGMGSVYRATHIKLGRVVALKVLRTDLAQDSDFTGRLYREARIANAIESPHVVDIQDIIEDGGQMALVMELIDGPTLADRLQAGPLSVKEACAIAKQIVNGLAAVHDAGFIHRDLKPSNIILREDPTGFFVKILDFGIGKVPEGDDEIRTMAGMMLGTPTYMAPEQVAALPVSPASDIFAFGAILYEMLTCRYAYAGRRIDVLRTKVHGRMPPLDLPSALVDRDAIRALITQCFASSPVQRPTVDQLRTRLSVLAERAAEGDGMDTAERTRWMRGRNAETEVAGPQTIVDLGVSPPPVHKIDKITVELVGDEADPDLIGGIHDSEEVVVPFWEPDLVDRTVSREVLPMLDGGFEGRSRVPCFGALIVIGGIFGALAQFGIGLLI